MKWKLISITFVLLIAVFIPGCLDQNNNGKVEKDDPLPEEVQLYFNHTDYFTTGSSKFLEVGGEPEGSNITWTIDDEIIGYGKIVSYSTKDSSYKFLKVDVKWGEYQKNRSMWIVINHRDSRGGYETSSNGSGFSEYGPGGYGISIDPAITIPSLMLNVTASQINGTFRYWIKLKEENKKDYFETAFEVEADLSEGNYSRSFFFDKLFFMERGDYEPYLIFFLYTIESNDGSYSDIATKEWLDY